MKSYTITVNGNVYDVTVEEKTAGFTPAQSACTCTRSGSAPCAGAAGSCRFFRRSGRAPGELPSRQALQEKYLKSKRPLGQSIQPGDPVVIIEAMKMEIPVVAPEAGTVASIDVAVGDAIEAGAVLATLN